MIRQSNCFLAGRRTHLPHTAGCPAVSCRGHYERMGLDVYVGSLTRYYVGDWLLIAQQVGEQMDMKVTVVRTEPEPADAITDPAAVLDTALRWQSRLCGALGGAQAWAERADLPYWTDKPGWDGFGGMVLLAAYDERPDLWPESAEDPGEFGSSPAYAAAAGNPQRYPSFARRSGVVAAGKHRASCGPVAAAGMESPPAWAGSRTCWASCNGSITGRSTSARRI